MPVSHPRLDLTTSAMALLGALAVLTPPDAAGGPAFPVAAVRPTDEPMLAAGSVLLFRAPATGAGEELWVSDGTTAGTELLLDIHPGAASSGLRGFRRVGDRVFFNADDGRVGDEPWVSDGTAAGTFLLRDVDGSIYGSSPSDVTVVGNRVFFEAHDGLDRTSALWVSDGTPSGTKWLQEFDHDFNVDFRGFDVNGVYAPAPFGEMLVFYGATEEHGGEPWVSDGTPAGTARIGDVNPGRDSGDPIGFTPFGGHAYFSAYGPEGRELYRTDGSSVELFADLVAPADESENCTFGRFCGSHPAAFTVVGAKLFFFTGVDGYGGLWATDGTLGGTARVGTANHSVPISDRPRPVVGTANRLFFFTGSGGASARRLWTSDGTAAGTIELAAFSTRPRALTVLGDRLFFIGDDGTTGEEVWISDGTVGGTHVLVDTVPGTVGGLVGSSLFRHQDAIYFGSIGGGLWRVGIDDGAATLVDDLSMQSVAPPSGFAYAGGHIFFRATDGSGERLWALFVGVAPGDDDGIPDESDNCPTRANVDQADGDGDGAGDVCDVCPADIDPDQADSDHDGIGDACDVCPNDRYDDADGDGLCADVDDCPEGGVDLDGDGLCTADDNCPENPDPDQTDSDGDGIGNLCDNCKCSSNRDQADRDGDGVGDTCDWTNGTESPLSGLCFEVTADPDDPLRVVPQSELRCSGFLRPSCF